MTREKAYKLRALIVKASAGLADEDAVEGVELFEEWVVDTDYATGDRRRRADRRERLQIRMDRKLSEAAGSMRLYAAQLEQRSPLVRLSGGYGYISDAEGRAVLSADAVEAGDILNIQLKDGRIEAAVERVHRGQE